MSENGFFVAFLSLNLILFSYLNGNVERANVLFGLKNRNQTLKIEGVEGSEANQAAKDGQAGCIVSTKNTALECYDIVFDVCQKEFESISKEFHQKSVKNRRN